MFLHFLGDMHSKDFSYICCIKFLIVNKNALNGLSERLGNVFRIDLIIFISSPRVSVFWLQSGYIVHCNSTIMSFFTMPIQSGYIVHCNSTMIFDQGQHDLDILHGWSPWSHVYQCNEGPGSYKKKVV